MYLCEQILSVVMLTITNPITFCHAHLIINSNKFSDFDHADIIIPPVKSYTTKYIKDFITPRVHLIRYLRFYITRVYRFWSVKLVHYFS